MRSSLVDPISSRVADLIEAWLKDPEERTEEEEALLVRYGMVEPREE